MDILKKLQAIRKLLGISYKDHVTNDAVRDRIRQAIGPCYDIYNDYITEGRGFKSHLGLGFFFRVLLKLISCCCCFIFNHGKEMEIEVVQWACIKVSTACYDNFTRNSARSEKKRSIKEGLGE